MKNLDLHIEDENFSVFLEFVEEEEEAPELLADVNGSLESEEGFDYFLRDLIVNKKVMPEKGDKFLWYVDTKELILEYTLVIVDVKYIFYKGEIEHITVYLKTI